MTLKDSRKLRLFYINKKGILMDNLIDKNTKSEMAYLMKHFSFMEEADFDLLDTGEFTVIQRMSYNYVEQSKTDTKVAVKVMKLIQWHDVDTKWVSPRNTYPSTSLERPYALFAIQYHSQPVQRIYSGNL